MATLLSFKKIRSPGWSNGEKAQLARIQKLLADAGVVAEIDLGMTDEGDPWCAICSGTSDEVIIHVARIDGTYLFDSAVLPTMIRGRSLDDCAQRFIDDAAVLARRPQHGSTVFMHPSALLAGVVLTIFLYVESIGESVARGRLPLESDGAETDAKDTDTEDTGTKDIVDVSPSGKKTAPEGDGTDAPLILLKQMLQQIADAAQKHEGDRTGAQGASHQGQAWGTALLSSGAVVAAIAYAQDSIAALSSDGDLVASAVSDDTAEDDGATPADTARENATDPEGMQGGIATDTATGTLPAPTDVTRVAPGDFLLTAQNAATASGNRAGYEEPTILVDASAEAFAEDRFVFTGDAAEAPLQDAQTPATGTPEASVAPLSPESEDVSAVSSLVRLMSGNVIEIQDEIFDLRDFIAVFREEEPATVTEATAAPPPPPLSPIPLAPTPAPPLPLPLPPVEQDAFVFVPSAPKVEIVSTRDVAGWITDFVRVTGPIRYDMSDHSHLAIYDRNVIGMEDLDDIASRSFTLQDESVVTFFGFGGELDMVFAA